MTSSVLTVLFEEPFWIGLYERFDSGHYEVCKITFGAEPKDYQVYEFVLRHWGHLRFSPEVGGVPQSVPHKNPKRVQREIRKGLTAGVGTKAQQALQMQREQNKQVRRTVSREQREAEKERQYALRQEKKKAKHKGR